MFSEEYLDIAVVIKAAPELGRRHGETVCVAGIDANGKWHRLYPVPFRDLNYKQRFNRWDIVRFRWRRPSDDNRIESKRIDPLSLVKLRMLKRTEIPDFVARAVVKSLDQEMAEKRSLALIRPELPRFGFRALSKSELHKSQRRRDEMLSQKDMFANTEISIKAPPYQFYYEFYHAGRLRKHTCIDWETEATFFKWRALYGEKDALNKMIQKWGFDIPQRGVVFAMGTHRVPIFKNWLLSGIIQAESPKQISFDL